MNRNLSLKNVFHRLERSRRHLCGLAAGTLAACLSAAGLDGVSNGTGATSQAATPAAHLTKTPSAAAATPPSSTPIPSASAGEQTNRATTAKVIHVMAIGGSCAHGWDDDKAHGGYLKRTFHALSQHTHAQFVLKNESVVGAGPKYYVHRMSQLLAKDQPDIVVMAFGLLDDLYHHTPRATLHRALKSEIREAVHSGSTVVVVTPTVTGASYVEFGHVEGPAVEDEIKTVKSVSQPKVHVVNLYSQMRAYLYWHHQNWHMYAADGWHPNAAGHALAASLLTQDLLSSRWLRTFTA
ncbi:MAG: SGNH/GDSL hydrolase family protein [Alicyclobacillus sp.]|nr:SGNH/GDSL hydrolase family protein [Alicyclobacillus sp.]